MSIWGKIIGGGTGFILGGPIGALLGVLAGHGVDRVRNSEKKILSKESGNYVDLDTNLKEKIFATGVIALAAKIAKADGKVSVDEIKKFKEIFEYRLEDEKTISLIFNEAKKSSDGYESYAKQLVETFPNNPLILYEVVNALFAISFVDGYLHKNEERIIKDISKIFGISSSTYYSIKASYTTDNNIKNSESLDELSKAYAVLGLSSDVTDKGLDKAYKILIKDYHPDRLVGYGLPRDFIDLANNRLAKINASYDYIKSNRK